MLECGGILERRVRVCVPGAGGVWYWSHGFHWVPMRQGSLLTMNEAQRRREPIREGGDLRISTPVEAPGVDFADAFSNRDSYLKTSHTFENLGVQAYLGAAGFIKDKAILQAAAGIFGVEARHAAVVGNLLDLEPEGGVYTGATETPLSKDEVLAAARPVLAGASSMSGGAAVTK